MVTRVHRITTILKLLSIIAGCLLIQQGELSAQVQFFTSPPTIDSFPVVKTKVSVAWNGRPAPITKSNLSVQEDGQNITNFELLDCDESDAASIAMLFDVSESMMVTLFRGSDEFYRSFVDFTLELTPTSELALVPFNDTVRRIIPATYRPQDFFKMNAPADVDEFLDSVGGLQFSGRTDVDLAVRKAAAHLLKGVNRRKAIVLVTDDGIYDREGLIALLNVQDISLFVLELDSDTIQGNIVTANATGGKFYSPKDSTEIGQTMSLIARAIYAKKCTLRYVSTHPCPWWSQKVLWVGLNYQKQNLAETHYFWLGPNRNDSLAPRLTLTQLGAVPTIVRATEDFPCERGIKSFTDSALTNFAKISRIRSLPQFAYDSLAVLDLSQAANGYYIAVDSNGNTSRIRINYTPPVDTLSPVWSVPFRSGEQFQLVVTEFRTWDKGLKSITLDPSATNVVIDSINYLTFRMAQVYISRLDKTLPASACLTATDSLGNDSNICVSFKSSVSDINPPVITQRPAASPYLVLYADISELRPGDRGIESISVTPLTNVSSSATQFVTPFVADATASIADSLYDAEALVTAIDSAGNSSQMKISYTPKPDVLAPSYLVNIDDPTTRTLTITEVQPWDRGLRSVSLIASSNVNTAQVLDTRRSSGWKIASVDPYVIGTVSFQALDSAGNSTKIDIEVPAQSPPADLPLSYTDPLDFGTVQASSLLRLSIDILNPNNWPVSIIRGYWTGDDSVFSLVAPLPSLIQQAGSQALSFEFHPKLLGDWSAVYTIETDKGTKYPVRMTGSSTGTVHISASNESVPMSGDGGLLNFAISGTPNVSNLDRVQFSIEVDDDVIALEAPMTNCSEANWLCNYDLSWSQASRGRYVLDLTRRSTARSLAFDDAPVLSVPFTSFMSSAMRSEVNILDASASRSSISVTDGSVAIGETCGDSIIIAALDQEVAGIRRHSLADGRSLVITFFSDRSDLVRVSLIDIRGIVQHEASMSVAAGENMLTLPVSDVTTGAYRVLITTSTSIYSRSVNILR